MKPNPMLSISVAVNFILIVVLAVQHFNTTFNMNYYRTFTGFLVQGAIKGIDSGNTTQVRDVLKRLPFRPEYSDLTTAVKALQSPDGTAAGPYRTDPSAPSPPPWEKIGSQPEHEDDGK